jgi:AcrR family transcriptional regulator
MDTDGARTMTGRMMRADARQNYQRLVMAAGVAFSEHGPAVSLEDVAKSAGVGIGTLYRHFPNRQALLEAVYREQVQVLCGRAGELLAAKSPEDALITWLRAVLTNNLSKRGLKETLMAGEISDSITECKLQMHRSGQALLGRAQAAGMVRPELEISDLLRLTHGIAMMVEPGVEGIARAERLFDVMVAGLRTAAQPDERQADGPVS